MKIMILLSSIFISAYASAGNTISSELFLASQHAAAISEFSKAVLDESLTDSAAGCPAAGFKIVNGTTSLSGSLMTAKDKVVQAANLALSLTKTLQAASYCGSCQQTVVTTPLVVTRPAKVKYQAACDNRPTTSFASDFQSDQEAENYTQDILNKKNHEGQRLYAACPDPCAFSVYAGKRTLPNGKVRSTLTVNCGQPRSSSILFAKYNYTHGTAVQWSCQK